MFDTPAAVAQIARLYASAETPLDIDDFLPPNLGKWPLSRPMARWLTRLVVGMNRASILEFGAGWSSLVLAHALCARGGGRLTSVEHQPEYARESWAAVQRMANIDAALVVTDLHRRVSAAGLLWSYRNIRRRIASRSPFDVLLIDAPPARYGRASPLHDSYPLLAAGAVIVLDDAARVEEQTVIKRWLATYPGLHLAAMDTDVERGIAVFVHDGSKRRLVAPRAIAGTVRDELRRVRSRRAARSRQG